MKILILSRDVRHVGGVVNFINVLIKNLSNRVHFSRQFIGKRIGSKRYLLNALYPIFDCIDLLRKIRVNSCDLVHLNPSMNNRSIFREGLFLLALRSVGFKKCVVLWHGWDQNLVNRIKGSHFFRLIFKNIYSEVSVMLVLANCFRNDLLELGIPDSKIRVTTTMFDRDVFKKRKCCNKQSEKNILFMSRLAKEKGVYELIDAFKLVSLKYPKTRLVVAGDGPELSSIKKIVGSDPNIKESVFFPGYVRDLDKGKVIMASGIFVFPTYHGEGCPVSLLEAMAGGLAVITTSVGAIPDIVENDINGIIIENIKPETIADAICTYIENKDFYNKVKKNNLSKAWDSYESEIVSNKMFDVYEEVIRT